MPKTLFDHLNHIYEVQDKEYFDNLDDADQKTFNVYMVTRFVSMNPDYLLVANELQKYWAEVGPREAYLFYSQILPKKRQFNKYIKGAKDASSYEVWVEEIVRKHYDISSEEVAEYLRIFYGSHEGKERLRELLVGYGIDEKKLKKAGV